MLELLRNEVIENTLIVFKNTLDAHIAKFFDTDAAAYRLSQRLLTLNTFIAPISKI